MTHNEFKDRIFEILNETEDLPIADIETDDNASEIKIILKDHTQFLITTAPYSLPLRFDFRLLALIHTYTCQHSHIAG